MTVNVFLKYLLIISDENARQKLTGHRNAAHPPKRRTVRYNKLYKTKGKMYSLEDSKSSVRMVSPIDCENSKILHFSEGASYEMSDQTLQLDPKFAVLRIISLSKWLQSNFDALADFIRTGDHSFDGGDEGIDCESIGSWHRLLTVKLQRTF
jgi:hypothetical protein